MAWTQTDVDAIDAAILEIVKSGTQTVKFSDGREVVYYSLSELLKARDTVKGGVAGTAGSTRCTYGQFSKG